MKVECYRKLMLGMTECLNVQDSNDANSREKKYLIKLK